MNRVQYMSWNTLCIVMGCNSKPVAMVAMLVAMETGQYMLSRAIPTAFEINDTLCMARVTMPIYNGTLSALPLSTLINFLSLLPGC